MGRKVNETSALTCINFAGKVRRRVHTPLDTPTKCSWPHIIYLWLCRSNWALNWVCVLPIWSVVATIDSPDYLWLGEVLANFGHSIIQWWTLTETRWTFIYGIFFYYYFDVSSEDRVNTHLQCMHRIANFLIPNFFVENQTEAMASFTIFTGRGKRMEMRIDRMFLGAKT